MNYLEKAKLFCFFLLLGVFIMPFSSHAFHLESLKPVAAPKDNPQTPEKIELGKKLFFDRRLSGDGTMSCVTCHDPETGYTDQLAISLSYPTTKNWRNSPSLINAAYNTSLFWDGRAQSLEKQALFPMMSAFEMNQNLDFLEEELKSVPEYVESFRKIFGGEITREKIAMALASFQRTIVSKNAPVDKFLDGDTNSLTPEQNRGYEIFTGKGKCVQCHSGANFTDSKFYNLGVPENPALLNDPRVTATMRFTAKVSGYKDYRTLTEDPGRYLVTKNKKDWKAFKTPGLREIALTGPYMHNGVFETLDEVIEFFNKGGGEDKNRSPLLEPLNLTHEEKQTLKVFLTEALKGEVTVVKTPEVP
ncbi:MAG: cytochrome-c peroxidase [Nitrospiraceae bacterium]|nr:MAG: cytochrome-c peroxidase [Nitrospiraceae bacterium]